MTPQRARAVRWGVGVLFLALVVGQAWLILSRKPRYEGDPAVLSQNEAAATRRVADLARRGAPADETEEDGYRFRSDGALAYAWPAHHGVTGIRTYAADAAGHVAWTNDARYAGAGRGPSARAALAPGAPALARVQRGEDGNEWRLLHE